MRASLRARGAAVALAAIVTAAAGVTILYCLQLAGYFVMPDELGYVQQAHFIGERLRPVLPGDPEFGSWSQLQPLLLAAPYALFATPTAFDVAHALNAFVMASAAIPAYLLMRRLSPWPPAAYLAAGLTVAVPWMTLAGTMLTENAAYPTFVWAAYAALVAIADPRPRHDLLLTGAIALAYLARTQLSLLAAGVAVAIVVHEIGWRWRGEPGRPAHRAIGEGLVASVRGHLVLTGLSAVGLAVVASSTSGTLLGGYAAPTEGRLLPPGTIEQAVEILAQVVTGIGVLPLALALAYALGSLARPRTREAHAFAALAIPTVALMALALGSFSVRFTAGVNDRYLFFLAPLLFCGALAFLLERRAWPLPLALGALGASLLVGSATMAQRGPSLVSPAAAFHDILLEAGIGGLPTTAVVLGLTGTLAVGAARALRPDRRRQTLAVGGALLAFGALETLYTMQKITEGQKVGADYLEGRDWLDRTLPGDATAAMLLADFNGDHYASSAAWWDLTFWNLDADRAVRFASSDDFIQKTTFPLNLDPRRGTLIGIDRRYLVVADTDRRLGLRDTRRVASRFGMTVLRMPDRPRASYVLAGTDSAGRIAPGATALLYVFAPARAGDVVLRLSGMTAPRSYRYEVAGRRGTVRRGREVTVRIPIDAPRAAVPSIVSLEVAGPAPVDPAGDPGPRVVGLTLPR